MNLERITAIITDDDPGHVILIKKCLSKIGVEKILTFKNGEELLLFFENKIEIADKNLFLLLDLRMPKIDGIHVLKKLKNDPLLKKIPVIIISTTEDTDEIENCKNNGCDYYLAKPIETKNMTEALTELMII